MKTGAPDAPVPPLARGSPARYGVAAKRGTPWQSARNNHSAWKRRAELTDAVPDAGREDPRSDDAARALQDSELGRALGRLPDKMRLIVHLHYYEGFSTEEIARLVHCAPATVRSRLSRARTQLGKMLGKGGIL